MKKLKIAALGVAALGFAAAPAGLTFAEAGTGDDVMNVTETVRVTIEPTCGIYQADGTTDASSTSYDAVTMTNGSLKKTGDADFTNWTKTYSIVCNDSAGWSLYAVGAGSASGKVNAMDASTNEDADDIETGVATSGETSNWAFKVEKAADTATGFVIQDNGVASTTYATFSAVPAAQAKILSASKGTNKTTGAFKTGYQVWIDSEQAAGSYTGVVKYTLVHPASAATPTA